MSFRGDDRNLVIEGDNLQVMVALKSQFGASVDVVYIDPPYNRGGLAPTIHRRALTVTCSLVRNDRSY